jgi:hypothetical protein
LIKRTVRDLLAWTTWILRNRREVSGLQLPSYEACNRQLDGRRQDCDWSHVKNIHDMYPGAPLNYELFLSVVGRNVCQDGKIWYFGNK